MSAKGETLKLVSVDKYAKGQLEAYAAFRAKIKHAPMLVQKVMIRAYGDACDDMAKIMDESAQEGPQG